MCMKRNYADMCMRRRLSGPRPSKHQALLWMGAYGKAFLVHMMKLVIFSSCLNIALLLVKLRPLLLALPVLRETT